MKVNRITVKINGEEWSFEDRHDILGTLLVFAPNGYSASVTKHERNPANILYLLAKALMEVAK